MSLIYRKPNPRFEGAAGKRRVPVPRRLRRRAAPQLNGGHKIHAAALGVPVCFGRHIHSKVAISMALNMGKPDKPSAIVPFSV